MKCENSKLFKLQNISSLIDVLSNGNARLKDNLNSNYHKKNLKFWSKTNTTYFFKNKSANKKLKKIYTCKSELYAEFSRNVLVELQEICATNIFEIPFLNSDIKGKSIFSELNIHSKNKLNNFRYVKLDIKQYFDNTSTLKIQNFFIKSLQMDKWVAEIFTYLVTIYDDKLQKHKLRRGIPSSGILAFLANFNFFSDINKMCENKEVSFSLYVDDMFFKLPDTVDYVEFINKIYKLAKYHSIKLNSLKTEVSHINSKRFKFHKLVIRDEILKATKKMKKEKKGNIYFRTYLKQISKNNKLIKRSKQDD
jgi:hypothetical protein